MRMYAACLASYNNGRLHGVWIDLENKDKADVNAEIAAMLRASPNPNVTVDCPECDGTGLVYEVLTTLNHACAGCGGKGTVPSAEEWAAHDWDGEGFDGFGEYPDLDKVLEHVRLYGEHGDAWLAFCDHIGADFATEDGFRDAYAGEANSPEEWAEDYLTECGDLALIPKNLRFYFDFEKYARDCEMSGDVSFIRHAGTLYVFHA